MYHAHKASLVASIAKTGELAKLFYTWGGGRGIERFTPGNRDDQEGEASQCIRSPSEGSSTGTGRATNHIGCGVR